MNEKEKQMAKEAAIADIQAELQKTSRCFIAFITQLDSVMDKLVENQLTLQVKAKK